MDISVAIWCMFGIGFFGGLHFGVMLGWRDNPNEPKPTSWEDKLHKRWMDGFKAGEKSMAKRMSERLKHEELVHAMWENNDGKTA